MKAFQKKNEYMGSSLWKLDLNVVVSCPKIINNCPFRYVKSRDTFVRIDNGKHTHAGEVSTIMEQIVP